MAFDPGLAERLRGLLTGTAFDERRMFGGLAFMVNGHMTCGVAGDEVMLRLGGPGAADALTQPGIREMDFTGRALSTMVFLTADAAADDAVLSAWVARAVAFTRSLPPR